VFNYELLLPSSDSSLKRTNSVTYIDAERTRITGNTCRVTTTNRYVTSPRTRKTQTSLLLRIGPCLQICCMATRWSNPLHTGKFYLNTNNIVAYRPIVKQWLCKQRPLLGNARNIHARNNRTTGLCNPFISTGSLNTPTTIADMLETVFSIRCVHSGYMVSWESAVEFQTSKWAVSREMGSAREAEKTALWVQMWSVNQRATVWPRKLKNLRCVKSLARKRLVETVIDWGHCVCQWNVKCSSEWCIQEVNKSNSQIHTPLIVTLPNTRHNIINTYTRNCCHLTWRTKRFFS
jgi:hypothetical protein